MAGGGGLGQRQLLAGGDRGERGDFAARRRERGVQFVGIGVDDAGKLAAFAAATPVSYPLLAASPADTPPGLQVKGLPFTVVIGRDGGIEMTRLGRIDEESLEPVLRRLTGQ